MDNSSTAPFLHITILEENLEFTISLNKQETNFEQL
jgi:hypothetical protein